MAAIGLICTPATVEGGFSCIRSFCTRHLSPTGQEHDDRFVVSWWESFVYACEIVSIWPSTLQCGNNVVVDRWIRARPIWQKQRLVIGLKYLWSLWRWRLGLVHSMILYPCVELVHSAPRGRELAYGHEIFKNQIFVCKQPLRPGDITFTHLNSLWWKIFALQEAPSGDTAESVAFCSVPLSLLPY